MKPLREEFDPTDSNAAAGAALLSRVRPLEESTSRRRRVRMALQASSPRRSGRFFSPVLVAAVLLVAGTGASATVTRLWKRSHFWQAPEPATRSAIEAAPRAPIPTATPVAPEAKLAANLPAPDMHTAPAVAGKIDVTPPPRVIPRRASAPKAPPAAIPSPIADPTNGPGAALMVEAMQARKAGDRARAAALLSDYQRQYPQGTFQEEALALSIESAAARGSESAPRLASDYLHRYPNGRFRELAQRALKSSSR